MRLVSGGAVFNQRQHPATLGSVFLGEAGFIDIAISNQLLPSNSLKQGIALSSKKLLSEYLVCSSPNQELNHALTHPISCARVSQSQASILIERLVQSIERTDRRAFEIIQSPSGYEQVHVREL
jgi:hypothetical protein